MKWVQTKTVDMLEFKGKGNLAPVYGPGICQHLQDDHGLGQEGIFAESYKMTTLQDMIGADPKAPTT